MLNELKREKYHLEQCLVKMKQELNASPIGSLRCSRNGNTDSYYIDNKYVSKRELKLIQRYVLRDYYAKLIPELEARVKQLENSIALLSDNPMQKVLDSQCKGRKVLLQQSVYQTIEQRVAAFEAQNIPMNTCLAKIETDYYTNKGEVVRSKSEKIIADALFYKNIPYKYEMPINLYHNNHIITFYPDFTTMNRRTGKVYIIEHLGMMGDAQYSQNAMKKIGIYEKNGYLIGKNLLIFHESAEYPLNTLILDSYIKEYLL